MNAKPPRRLESGHRSRRRACPLARTRDRTCEATPPPREPVRRAGPGSGAGDPWGPSNFSRGPAHARAIPTPSARWSVAGGAVSSASSRRSSSAGQDRSRAARSSGLASWQRSSERHPQPMHSVSPSLRRSSSAIRSSIRDVHVAESRDQSRRVGAWWGRKLGELAADLLERQPDALGEDDEGDPAQHRPRVATVARTCPLGADQSSLLVEAKRRRGHAAAACDLADREQAGHG